MLRPGRPRCRPGRSGVRSGAQGVRSDAASGAKVGRSDVKSGEQAAWNDVKSGTRAAETNNAAHTFTSPSWNSDMAKLFGAIFAFVLVWSTSAAAIETPAASRY